MKKRFMTRADLRSIIREHMKKIKEAEGKAAPFGSGNEPVKLDKDQKDIVGHT